MCSNMIIQKENQEYSPGERDLNVWLWLMRLQYGSFGLVSNSAEYA